MSSAPAPGPPPLWRRLISKHPVRRGGLLVLLALVLEYLVLPQIAGVRRSLHLLGRVNMGYVALGAALEVASLASYAQLTRAVLPSGASSFSRIWRIDLSTLAVSHVLPGGTAGGDGLGYRLLTNEGISGGDAGLALAVQGIGSALVLNAILWLALIASVPVSGFNPIYATAAIVGALLLAAFAGLVLLLTRGEEKAAVIITELVARLPFLKPGTAERTDRTVHEIANRAKIMLRDRALLQRAVFWASANWLLDAGSLFVFLLAFGHIENPDGLLVAYGLAYVLAAIPITPGGLGVVEGVLVPSLVGFGATRGAAIVAVIGYRLVNFWLPVPVGAGAYLSLRVAGDRKPATRRDHLRGAVEVAKSLGPLVRHPGPPVGLAPGAKRSPDAGPEAPADGRRPPGQGG